MRFNEPSAGEHPPVQMAPVHPELLATRRRYPERVACGRYRQARSLRRAAFDDRRPALEDDAIDCHRQQVVVGPWSLAAKRQLLRANGEHGRCARQLFGIGDVGGGHIDVRAQRVSTGGGTSVVLDYPGSRGLGDRIRAALPGAVGAVTAFWGGHEGSMLLWQVLLACWSVAVAWRSRALPADFVARVLAVLGWVSVGFLLFVLFLSNPFLRLVPAALEGKDLNPLLQDPGMVFHPPLLYMGYVGFVVPFAFALAALISGELGAAWARWSRSWTLAAWGFLTLGILLGSAWAYYVLGWGGWWFWDPVENASFMPWLVGTALLHSLIVTDQRGAFRSWSALLAICAFSLCLLGTFLVRSGVLTSVHAFAVDPGRGLFILCFIVAVVGVSLWLYAWRAPELGTGGGQFALLSRETLLLVNNVLFCAAALAVLIGTLYPLILETLTGEKISVGAPFFNLTFGLLMIPILIVTPFGPMLAWKRGDLLGAFQRLYVAAAIAALAGLTLWYVEMAVRCWPHSAWSWPGNRCTRHCSWLSS